MHASRAWRVHEPKGPAADGCETTGLYIQLARADFFRLIALRLFVYTCVRPTPRSIAVIKSIETPDIDDRDGVPFQIFYGISGNDHNFWSIANARKIIGYEPEDNSSVRFIDAVAKHVEAAKAKGVGK